MRNKKLQKKAVNFALDKSKPFIENVGSQMLDSLSTKIRPNKNMKQIEKIQMEVEFGTFISQITVVNQ